MAVTAARIDIRVIITIRWGVGGMASLIKGLKTTTLTSWQKVAVEALDRRSLASRNGSSSSFKLWSPPIFFKLTFFSRTNSLFRQLKGCRRACRDEAQLERSEQEMKLEELNGSVNSISARWDDASISPPTDEPNRPLLIELAGNLW